MTTGFAQQTAVRRPRKPAPPENPAPRGAWLPADKTRSGSAGLLILAGVPATRGGGGGAGGGGLSVTSWMAVVVVSIGRSMATSGGGTSTGGRSISGGGGGGGSLLVLHLFDDVGFDGWSQHLDDFARQAGSQRPRHQDVQTNDRYGNDAAAG